MGLSAPGATAGYTEVDLPGLQVGRSPVHGGALQSGRRSLRSAYQPLPDGGTCRSHADQVRRARRVVPVRRARRIRTSNDDQYDEHDEHDEHDEYDEHDEPRRHRWHRDSRAHRVIGRVPGSTRRHRTDRRGPGKPSRSGPTLSVAAAGEPRHALGPRRGFGAHPTGYDLTRSEVAVGWRWHGIAVPLYVRNNRSAVVIERLRAAAPSSHQISVRGHHPPLRRVG